MSALIAARFSAQGASYQAASAQATALHDMFVATLTSSAGSYASTEAVNVIAAG